MTRIEGGSMTAETVLLAPVFLLFLMLLVGAGRIVEAQGEVNGAARDAARAASVQRDLGAAEGAAIQAAEDSLGDGCQGGAQTTVGGNWDEGGQVEVTVNCTINLDVVAFLGFSASKQMIGTAVVPLEKFRRVD